VLVESDWLGLLCAGLCNWLAGCFAAGKSYFRWVSTSPSLLIPGFFLHIMDRTSEPNIPIASIAKIGLQIAAAIQTYVQAFDESDRSLADVAINIYNSASALEQLRKIIDEDESARIQQNPLYVLKDEGRTQIEALAAQCHRLYNAIIDFVSKARRPGQEANLSVSHPETHSF
jgi:hypothetical protein